MAGRTWITVFLPTQLIFRYHLPLNQPIVSVDTIERLKRYRNNDQSDLSPTTIVLL